MLEDCGGSDNSNNSTAGNTGGNNSIANDQAILQYALHLKYLEAEFYSYATTGQGLEGKVELTGVGTLGQTAGKFGTNFTSQRGAVIAQETAKGELTHVQVARPAPDCATVPRGARA